MENIALLVTFPDFGILQPQNAKIVLKTHISIQVLDNVANVLCLLQYGMATNVSNVPKEQTIIKIQKNVKIVRQDSYTINNIKNVNVQLIILIYIITIASNVDPHIFGIPILIHAILAL
jgi:hypothetical protein